MHRKLTRRDALFLLGGATLATLQSSCATAPATAGTEFAPDRDPLHYRPLTDVARLIESRAISSLELTERILERIEALDGRLHSYYTVSADQARQAARSADAQIRAGRYRGALHGMPIAVKDLYQTQGIATTGGLSFLRGAVPDEDATVIARLRAAGAVLLGKLATTEGAMAGYHRDFPIPVNPWVAGRWTGGSSSGSGVATAAGLCYGSLGSDTGGSIRFPAAANGLVGLKPTYGRVSRFGVMPLAESLDHVGPMTRTVADAAAMLQAIAGWDPRDSTSLDAPVPDYRAALEGGLRGLRISFDPNEIETAGHDGYAAALRRALAQLESLGATLIAMSVPAIPGPAGEVWFTIAAYEAFRAHREYFKYNSMSYGEYFSEFLKDGAAISAAAYGEAQSAARAFASAYREQLASVDALAGPAAGPAFPITDDILYGPSAGFDALLPLLGLQYTLPANLAGVPTICLPCGFSAEGVPLSLQLTGRPLAEPMLLRIAHGYEQSTAWHTRHPPL